MTKRDARNRAKTLRAGLNMKAIGSQMAQPLFALPQWQKAEVLLGYVSLPDEPDTLPLLQRTLQEGKRLLLPRVTGPHTMNWVEISHLDLLQRGAYGIWEPPAGLPSVQPYTAPNALALVPCLAASCDGVRLGRGGGYYDRFLEQYKGERLLLCPSALVWLDVPNDDWDIRFAPEEILTEKGILI